MEQSLQLQAASRRGVRLKREKGSHGGSDPRIIAEFLRYVREGGKITTSPVAARYSVAAGCQATASLRAGGKPLDVPPLAGDVNRYFQRTLSAC